MYPLRLDGVEYLLFDTDEMCSRVVYCLFAQLAATELIKERELKVLLHFVQLASCFDENDGNIFGICCII